jgi:serpin B
MGGHADDGALETGDARAPEHMTTPSDASRWPAVGDAANARDAMPSGDPTSDSDAEAQGPRFIESSLIRMTTPAPPADVSRIVAGNTAFAWALYRELGQEPAKNIWFSPWSLTEAIAMAWTGASGAAATEIATVFGFWNDPPGVHAAIDTLDQKLVSESGTPVLHTANAFWISPSITPLSSYLDTLATYYGAGVGVVDFEDRATAIATINGWVSSRTEGTIPNLLQASDFPSLTTAVLTNALYLKAAWAEPFFDWATENRTFTRRDGSEVTVPMMSGWIEAARYTAGPGYRSAALPYHRGGDGPALEMVFILPEGDLSTLEESLDAASLTAIFTALAPQTVELRLPRFSMRASARLRPALTALGMPTPFMDGNAFSGISEPPPGAIYQVVHEGFVSVDEAGTEASAATAVIFGDASASGYDAPPPTVWLDRPFVIAIRQVDTGTLLFLASLGPHARNLRRAGKARPPRPSALTPNPPTARKGPARSRRTAPRARVRCRYMRRSGPNLRRLIAEPRAASDRDAGVIAASSPTEARFALSREIVALLAAASRDAPLLMLFEDLHAADRSTLLVLELVANPLRALRVMVLGSYRDLEASLRPDGGGSGRAIREADGRRGGEPGARAWRGRLRRPRLLPCEAPGSSGQSPPDMSVCPALATP